MKRILIINAGSSQKNHVFQRIGELGYHVTVMNPDILEDIEDYIDAWIFADLMNISECLEKIEQEHQKSPFDGILTFWEEDVLLAAEAAERVGLPGIDFALAKQIRNKYEFRKLCEETGIITPKFLALYDGVSEEEIAKNMSFPCILKPVYGACSAFVRKCYSPQEACTYFYETLASSEFQKETQLGNVKDLFLESYIGGQEVDIDMLVQNGEIYHVSLIDNIFGNDDFFIELGQCCPSHFSSNQEEIIKNQAKNYIKKIGIQNACIHFEAKIENELLIPLELNMRMGGDEIWYSNKDVYGVDLVEQAIKIACGENIEDFTRVSPKYRVISEDILSEKAGYIKEISIDTETISNLGVSHFGVLKKVGSYIGKPPEDFSYVGWYMIQKDIQDMNFSIEKRQEIKNCFHIKIEE